MNLNLRLANYISRYAPSKRRVLAYLDKKQCLDPSSLLEKMGYDESMMCDIWMRSLLTCGKWKNEIRLKLQKKEFPRDLIVEKLDFFDTEIHDWESNRLSILHQIQTLEQRGKSRRIILTTLISRYSYFRDEITELLSETNDADNLQKEVQKYKNKYNIQDPKEKQKFYAALIRKWFDYHDIKNSIANIQSPNL